MSGLSKKQIRKIMKEYNLVKGEDIQSALKDMFKDVLQEMLEAELETELGYTKHDEKNKETDNTRNGYSKKKINSEYGELEINIPRDRKNEYDPIAVEKYKKDLTGISKQVIKLYARGMSHRDIYKHMKDLYGVKINKDKITQITNKIIPKIKEWQNRPLSEMYPVVFFDAMFFNVKHEGRIIKKPVYIALGVNKSGYKEILGMWIGPENESSKYWLKILNELKHRGLKDILIAAIDGLSGFSNAVNTAYPKTEVQSCIIHQIRNSTKYVSRKDLKEFTTDMKKIYRASSLELAEKNLKIFSDKWQEKYGYAVDSWNNNWAELSEFFNYSAKIRKLIYTTNPIEGYNRQIRKYTKSKSVFPSDMALMKQLFLIMEKVTESWTKRRKNWGLILNELEIYFGKRVSKFL